MNTVDEKFPFKNVNKNAGKIKCNDRSDMSYYRTLQTRDNDESLNISKMFSPIARRAQSTLFFPQQQQFNPITSPKQTNMTYTKQYNQRKLNNTITRKQKLSSPCNTKSLINSTDSRFAIQSQPNQLYIDRSYYFNSQQTIDYSTILKSKQTDKEIAALKMVKILAKIDPLMYMKTFFMINMKEKLYQSRQIEQKSFQQRQLQYIDILYDGNNQRNYHKKFHDQKMNNIKIPYYNKLIGLCNPKLITKQILKTTDKNIQQIKVQKQQIKMLQTPPKSDQSFIFNFQITPKPPIVSQEKKLVKNTYSSLKFSSEKKIGKRVY